MEEEKGRCEYGKKEVLEVEFKLGAHSAHAFAHTGAGEGCWEHCDPPNTTGLENIACTKNMGVFFWVFNHSGDCLNRFPTMAFEKEIKEEQWQVFGN